MFIFIQQIEALPGRWKKKQFVTQRRPQNSHDGYFYKVNYQHEPYTEIAEQYRKTQPLEKRKLGFGSHDAWKSGEFTSTKATERYRDVVKKESKQFDKEKTSDSNISKLIKKLDQQRHPPKDKLGNDLKEPKFLYDIGRTHVTSYTPNSTHDSFYRLPKHAAVNPKLKGKDPVRRLGKLKTMSSAIGEQAWSHDYGKPEYGVVSYVEKFYDRGHIECKGF